jgi:two-component system, NtrC family, response regulator PilR
MLKKILIVDDEPATLFAYQKLFQEPGVAVVTAQTLEEVEALLNDHQFEIVITDLRLSGKKTQGGFDVLRFAKECHPETKVILTTAYGSSEVMKKAYELGVSCYLEKPVPIKTLRETLHRLGIETTAKRAMNGAPEAS